MTSHKMILFSSSLQGVGTCILLCLVPAFCLLCSFCEIGFPPPQCQPSTMHRCPRTCDRLGAVQPNVPLQGRTHLGTITGGTPAPDPLRRPPPPSPPPPSLEIGWKVPDHGRRRRPKEILLDLVQGEKMGFHHMCLYSKCSVFGGQPNSG